MTTQRDIAAAAIEEVSGADARGLPDLRIFQIFSGEEARRHLDPGFIPLDNSTSSRPDWREFWAIRNFLLSNELDERLRYGFLSPQFHEKTGLQSAQVHELVRGTGMSCEVLAISHDLDQLAYFKNPFERGEYWHPNLINISRKALREIGLDFDPDSYVAHSGNYARTEFLVAKPVFWRRWLQLAMRFFDYAEDARHGMSKVTIRFPSGQEGLKVFIQAQLASILLAGGEFKVLTSGWNDRRVTLSSPITGGQRSVRLLGACDLLKQEYEQRRDAAYLDMHRRLRASVPVHRSGRLAGPSIAFVTTSKGRLHHVQQTLPRILAEHPDQVVVVDYDCPQGTGAWVVATHPGVIVVRVKGDSGFCLPLARNSGSRACNAEWICFIDADVMVAPGFVGWLRQNLDPLCFFRASNVGGLREMETYGTFVCTRDAFNRIGGFDEVFRGWGGEDDDIYRRLAAAGYQEREYPLSFVAAIPHPEEQRTAFHPVKSRTLQLAINKGYLAMKSDLTRISGEEPPVDLRRQLMKRIRDEFTHWADDPTRIPRVSQEFTDDFELERFPGYRLTKKLVLTASRVGEESDEGRVSATGLSKVHETSGKTGGG